MKPVLRKIRLFCMQEENYAERIKLMGAEPEKIVVTGNMKFDSAVNAVSGVEALSVKAELGLAKDEDVFIAGSTHPGEDEVVLDVYKKLKEHFKNLRLIIAPRHIERAGNVEALARKMGLMPARVSGHKSQKGSVLILDIMGKLAELYSVATIVFMGGSLIPKGGQNILEPAIFGKPILFGPNMFNFSSVTNFFLERSAARMVGTKDELFSASKELLADFEKRRELGENAKRAVGENLGAAQRNLEKIERYL